MATPNPYAPPSDAPPPLWTDSTLGSEGPDRAVFGSYQLTTADLVPALRRLHGTFLSLFVRNSAAQRVVKNLQAEATDKIRIELNPERVIIENEASTISFVLRRLAWWEETPECFMLSLQPTRQLVHLLPKRAFAAADLPVVRARLALARRKGLPRYPLKQVGLRTFGLWLLLVGVFTLVWMVFSPSR